MWRWRVCIVNDEEGREGGVGVGVGVGGVEEDGEAVRREQKAASKDARFGALFTQMYKIFGCQKAVEVTQLWIFQGIGVPVPILCVVSPTREHVHCSSL
jgi:hypothetical protein